jgi:iron complex outermembrane recepter protein
MDLEGRNIINNKLYLVRKILIIFCLLLFSSLSAQDEPASDTATARTVSLREIFITATRTPEKMEEVPARLNAIDQTVIEAQPAITTDALLEVIPGANIDRPQGIFSKNASITMRGLNGTPRILVLVDGVPISKTDGGGVNWNRMVPDNIDRIEVIKGPVSAVYGGNAMAGVINVITREPVSKLEGEVKTFYGSCNTFGGFFRLGGRLKPSGNSLYYNLNAFYRQGDGYIIVPPDQRDSLDVKTYLKEGSAAGKIGYRYGSGSFTEIEYSYYNDKRGDGTRIYEPEGGYNRYPTNNIRLASTNYFGKFNWIVRYFYQNEHYLRQSETMSQKKGNKYTLYNTDASRIDQGLWTNLSYKMRTDMELTFGLDLKQGSVVGKDIYLTSTDILENKGKMDFLALFAEYEWKPLDKKMSILAGLRYDVARFYDGAFTIVEPTTLTEFMTSYPTEFEDETWHAWSPKLGIKYGFSKAVDLYFSYSHGFRPAMLDDICRNGNISKGFKLANPELQPENVDNFEIGANLKPLPSVSIEPSLYYTLGTDFQYFVGNGDSVATGGDNLKPVLQRQNVSQVKVLGAEITLTWKIIKPLYFTANYAYNDSRITKFDTTGRVAKDLTGKFLMEVPVNQAFSGLFYNSRLLSATVVFNYKGAQWSDDENTQKTPAYSTFDIKIGKTFINHLTASLVVQDIFNTRYYDSKGNISPGRFFMLNLSYHFIKS